MVVCAEADRVRFARSQAVLKRRTALGLPEMSFFDLRLNSCKDQISLHNINNVSWCHSMKLKSDLQEF